MTHACKLWQKNISTSANKNLFPPQVSMDWALVVVLQVLFQPSLSVLFTVDAEQTQYTSEFGGTVVMGCRFSPKPADLRSDLKVTWHRTAPNSVQEVIRIDNGVEHATSQKYQGRVRLLTDELQNGWAKLEMSRLRINDSGVYRCLVHTGEGADYKSISLSVGASYKSVTKHVEEAAEGDEVVLTCQSEGFPQSSVVWQDVHGQTHNPSNASASVTPEELFRITSQIRVSSSEKNSYTCNVVKDGSSATFHIPEEIPRSKNDAVIVTVSMLVIVGVVVVGVLAYRRRKKNKGSRAHSTRSTRNLLVDSRDKSASTCIQIDKENEDGTNNMNDGHTEETLGLHLKAHYSKFSFSEETHSGAFGAEELPQRLQNNDGQPVNPLALLPEPGETVLLEGSPGSGKTTVAHILVSSWTGEPPQSNPIDLSVLSFLLYVNCSAVKEDLYQEIRTQLSLTEQTSSEELRTALTKSSKVLLLLDGYSEGNPVFDESLRGFLSNQGGCRVLITACPGHCPTLMQTAGIGGMLKFNLRSESL
ncbi:uncharacterized protein LOC103363383 isoform X2 [Stegastes partitus]|uniref:Uncharacterized protein LOC103363383 isoform X2 n=1 Tax=Stegastes partitus TaxID=144197 RepID=A0A9Y4KF06_9TELE|nr:PREDICTED: uncharacterized protein LOC103363383 isoform X2 [Stegastes partitus]